jgi:hypothetical protein
MGVAILGRRIVVCVEVGELEREGRLGAQGDGLGPVNPRNELLAERLDLPGDALFAFDQGRTVVRT